MPNKTIYVKDADREIWEKAEELAGGSVSALITEALRRYVEEEERKEQVGMEDIYVELWRGPNNEPYTARLVGQWLLEADADDTRTMEPGFDAGAYYGVALTQRGNLAVYIQHNNEGVAPILRTYGSFEDAEKGGVPGDILAKAAAGPGADYVQTLDI